MAYGDLYNQALSQWNGLGQDAQLRQLGFTPNYQEGFGYNIPTQYANNFNTGGDGSNDAALQAGIAKSTAFDKQKFYQDQGIVTGYANQGQDGAGATDEQRQAYSDNFARSFNQFGFNFQGYDDYLQHMTGPGHYEQDATLGKTWVPDNHDYQSWNNSAMTASGAPQGGFIQKAVGNYLNSGGPVKTVAGAVLGAGAGDIFNGGLDSLGNILNSADVPYDVGQNLANNPDIFGNSNAVGSSLTDQLTNWLTKQGTNPSNILKLFGGGGSGGGGTNTGGNMTTQSNSTLDDIFGLGAKTIPSLLAYNYFQNLPKPDTAQYQTLINKAGDMSGPLGQYDLNTATGRGTLNSSLAARGVSGSSFGDQSLTNYDTQRDLGRGSLGFGGLATQGALLNNMNNTTVSNNKNSTDFLGRLLGGLGGTSGTDGTASTGGIGNILSSLYKNVFGGSNPSITGSTSGMPDLSGLLSGTSNTDWISSLFNGGSTTNPTDQFGVNGGLTLGTSGIGTNNPLTNWLTGGATGGMANLSNLWGW